MAIHVDTFRLQIYLPLCQVHNGRSFYVMCWCHQELWHVYRMSKKQTNKQKIKTKLELYSAKHTCTLSDTWSTQILINNKNELLHSFVTIWDLSPSHYSKFIWKVHFNTKTAKPAPVEKRDSKALYMNWNRYSCTVKCNIVNRPNCHGQNGRNVQFRCF